MSFAEKLPEYIADTAEEIRKLDQEIKADYWKIEETDHECDCEFCEYIGKPLLSPKEIESIEKTLKGKETQRKELSAQLRRLEWFADNKGVNV